MSAAIHYDDCSSTKSMMPKVLPNKTKHIETLEETKRASKASSPPPSYSLTADTPCPSPDEGDRSKKRKSRGLISPPVALPMGIKPRPGEFDQEEWQDHTSK